MTRDELREAVAELICANATLMSFGLPDQVIALVLEEAARVADGPSPPDLGPGGDGMSPYRSSSDGKHIARAIRAMIPGGPDGKP